MSATTCLTEKRLVSWARSSHQHHLRFVFSFVTICMGLIVTMYWGFWQRDLVVKRRTGSGQESRVHRGYWALWLFQNLRLNRLLWVRTDSYRWSLNDNYSSQLSLRVTDYCLFWTDSSICTKYEGCLFTNCTNCITIKCYSLEHKLIILSFYCVRLSLRLREVAHRIVTQLWITLSLVKGHVLVSTHMQTHSLIHTDRI